MTYTRLISMLMICAFFITGCASKFAPVVSRPDNLIIDCPTGCKLNIPMNTEIMVARNTNGYDMGKELIRQIPFIGALALSWKSMDVAENIADAAIDSFNRGTAMASEVGDGAVTYNTTTTTTTGDTITSGDIISTETDSSGSGNSADSVVETHSTAGDTIGGDNAGGDMDKSVENNPIDYSNRSVTYPVQ